MKTLFALQSVTRFEFHCVAKTKEEFEHKLNQCFWNWKGMQPKDKYNYGKDDQKRAMNDYMKRFKKVKISIRDM